MKGAGILAASYGGDGAHTGNYGGGGNAGAVGVTVGARDAVFSGSIATTAPNSLGGNLSARSISTGAAVSAISYGGEAYHADGGNASQVAVTVYGARVIRDALLPARTLIADRGYDSAWFRNALTAKGIAPCIPSSRGRQHPFAYDTAIYRQRHKVENLFAKLKDWRRIATRYDRCAHTFFSAICIAATVIFWL